MTKPKRPDLNPPAPKTRKRRRRWPWIVILIAVAGVVIGVIASSGGSPKHTAQATTIPTSDSGFPDQRPAPTAADKTRIIPECENALKASPYLAKFPAAALNNNDPNAALPDWVLFQNIDTDRMVNGGPTPGAADVDQFVVTGNLNAHDSSGDGLLATFECDLPVGHEVPPVLKVTVNAQN